MSARFTFSLFHPTARVHAYPSFPRGWRDACESFFNACDHPEEVEYVISVHESRWEEFHASEFGPLRLDLPAWGGVRVVKNFGRDSVVDQCNIAAAASEGAVLFGVMDDLRAPAHWDTQLRRAIPRVDEPWVIHCSTGSSRDKDLIVAGAMTRARYREIGFILPPQFESMYSDDFITRLHRERGCVRERFDIVFEHLHPLFGKGESDEIYELQNRPEAYASGKAALDGSRGDGRTLALVMPGEKFSSVWVTYWSALIAHVLERGFRLLNPPFAGYDSNVYRTRGVLLDALLETFPAPDLVLWLDDDNVLTAEQFDRLVATLDAQPELDMAAGWCFCAADSYSTAYDRPSCGVFLPDGRVGHLLPEKLSGGAVVPVDWTGFPVVLMRGSTLAKVGVGGFDPIIDATLPGRFLGEDLAFCKRLVAVGGHIAVDSEVLVPHFKLRADAPPEVMQQLRESLLAAVGPGKVEK